MTRQSWWIILGVVGLMGVSAQIPCGWAESDLSPYHGQDQVDQLLGRYNLHPAFDKLGRGLSNALGGWLEIPLNVGKRYSTSDTGASFFTGLAHGVFKGVVRTGVGLYETATFFLPYPEEFAPILPTLQYYQKEPKRPPYPLE